MGWFDWLFRRAPTPLPPTARTDIELPADPKPHPVVSTPSERCIAFIKDQEKLILKAEKDVDDVWINGYGCKIIDGKPAFDGQIITPEIADRSCRVHALKCAAGVLQLVQRPLTQGQLDALVDFVYNAGIGALKQSTLLRTFNVNQPVTEAMFTAWSKAHVKGQFVTLDGLVKRRKGEFQMWLS